MMDLQGGREPALSGEGREGGKGDERCDALLEVI